MANIDRNVIRVRDNLQTEVERNAQEYFIRMASEHTDECLEKYKNLKSSRNGKYICSDLVKEIFDIYRESKSTRNLYASAVHNSAACLANEQFQRNAIDESITDCIFITGSPGVGKSFFVQSLYEENQIPSNYVIYEGDLNALETIKQKMNVMLEHGKKIHIIILDAEPELSFKNAASRLHEIGRGASKATIARILSRLSESLVYLNNEYSDLDIGIYRKNSNTDIDIYNGIEYADIINHGSYDEIIERLNNFEKNLENGNVFVDDLEDSKKKR